MRNYQAQGVNFVWHGVTHQYNKQPNPASGITGEDFEFWDAVQETPIREDRDRKTRPIKLSHRKLLGLHLKLVQIGKQDK